MRGCKERFASAVESEARAALPSSLLFFHPSLPPSQRQRILFCSLSHGRGTVVGACVGDASAIVWLRTHVCTCAPHCSSGFR